MGENGKKQDWQNESIDEKRKHILKIMVHDLRTPLNAVVGFSGMAKETAKKYQDKKLDQFLDIIEQQALQTAQLITAFARWHSETGKKEEINIGDIFAETIAEQENTAKEKQVGIVSTQGLELTTYTDKNMIKTLLRNLVGNAIKHTPQGGEVRMGATQNNGKLKITVTDNGQGITPEKVNRIFNPPDSVNWTNIQTGMGIGLYLCKKIIEWEGGEISVESIQEKGSTFYFTIPTHDKKKT